MKLLSRYVVAQYLRVFATCLVCATAALFFFEVVKKLGTLSAYAADSRAVGAYLALKIPNLVRDAYPATALLSALVGLGLMVRRNEVLALRACGVSPRSLLIPLVAASLLVSFAVLTWCERIVPAASSRSRLIRDNVIKQRDSHGFRGTASIWVRSPAGFVSVDYYEPTTSRIHGVTIFQTDPATKLKRWVEARSAIWRGDRWELVDASVKEVGPHASVHVRPLDPQEVVLREAPLTFDKRRPKAKEMTYRELGGLIESLETRGLAAEELRVERHMKLAWPLSGAIGMWLAFPLAMRGGRRSGLAFNIAAGLAVGFAYWAVLAVCAASGKTGGMPPAVAAWAPNALFAVVGCVLLARADA